MLQFESVDGPIWVNPKRVDAVTMPGRGQTAEKSWMYVGGELFRLLLTPSIVASQVGVALATEAAK